MQSIDMGEAYAEVLEILNYVPEENYKKIPGNFITFMEENADENSSFVYNLALPFNKQNVNDDAKDILALIYRLFIANDDEKKILNELDNPKKSVKLKDLYYDIPDDNCEATRVTSGKILNAIAKSYKLLIGGSADVASSTYAKLNDYEDRTINFGVREHAMGVIANGLALVGLTPFVSTFLSFSDYYHKILPVAMP